MNVVYITNRGGTHPNRLLYTKSIAADYQYVDFRLQWQRKNTASWKIIVSGIICALTFPGRKKYDLFITSDPQLPAILMKKFGLLRKQQKVVSYLGSQTLYFIYSGYYSKWTSIFYKFLLKNYDAHICNGPLQADLLQQIIDVSPDKIKVNFNGIGEEKLARLSEASFDANGHYITFIGNLYSDWRLHYKGIDLMLDAFQILLNEKKLKFRLIGDYTDDFIQWVKERYGNSLFENLEIVGKVKDISSYLNGSTLYLHCSRGDACPNAVVEAMATGIPCMVSRWTGTRELIEQVSDTLITDIDKQDIADKVMAYLNLPEATKHKMSQQCRAVVSGLTQENAVNRFKEIVHEICNTK